MVHQHTQYWSAAEDRSCLSQAAAALAAGGVVAFPTETVYGLGADARSDAAVRRIFEAKGRPSDNPLIVHLADVAQADELAAVVTETERRLMAAFWPGPLTLVLPVRPEAVSPLVTAGLDTVGIRVPAHGIARELIRLAGCPVAAPSANRSGRPSPTTAAHVREDLDGRIDGIVDGGPAGVGLESTVVRVLEGAVHVLRPGGVTAEQLAAAAGPDVRVVASPGAARADEAAQAAQADRPRSPGVKYTHYAPRGEMLLVTGAQPRNVADAVRQAAAEARARGARVGIVACAEHASLYEGAADEVFVCGSRARPETAAQALFAVLRQCDERGMDFIVSEGYPETGIGAAVMNRLRKAAGGRELRL